jgi:hypothetical protein
MDAPPVNKLLQLLRQKPPEPPDPSPVAQPVPPHVKRHPSPASRSGIQHARKNGTQTARNSAQYATPRGIDPSSDGVQYATQDGPQPATSNTQTAADRSIPHTPISGIQYATGSDIPLVPPSLSKGQQRVLQFLVANRDPTDPSRTVTIGYHAISTYCFLSRNGARKVIEELCKKCLITRIATQRGEMQGSIYGLESNVQYATISSTPHPGMSSEENSLQYATNVSSSSSKKLLLQDLVLEDAFHNLNPRSLEPYIEQFEATEDLQNFLDIANACIAAAKSGRGKPIQNPHGFLLAQLRAGYINPPEGYKSRKVRAQEMRNQQLEEELATLRQLKEQERELRLALFEASLTDDEQQRLELEARALVNPNMGLSTARQVEIQKDAVLKSWFEQREKDKSLLGATSEGPASQYTYRRGVSGET